MAMIPETREINEVNINITPTLYLGISAQCSEWNVQVDNVCLRAKETEIGVENLEVDRNCGHKL